MDGVLEGTWLQLLFEIDHDHRGLVVIVWLEFGHWHHSVCVAPIYQISRDKIGFSTDSTPTTGVDTRAACGNPVACNCYVAQSHTLSSGHQIFLTSVSLGNLKSLFGFSTRSGGSDFLRPQ